MGLLDVRLQPMQCTEMSATVLTIQRCPTSAHAVCRDVRLHFLLRRDVRLQFFLWRDVRLQFLLCRGVRRQSFLCGDVCLQFFLWRDVRLRYDGGGQAFCGEDQEGKRQLTASASSQPFSDCACAVVISLGITLVPLYSQLVANILSLFLSFVTFGHVLLPNLRGGSVVIRPMP